MFPASLPDPHRQFISRLLDIVPQDPRFVGVSAAGSFLTDVMDEFSDVDLILAVEPGEFENVMRERRQIAEKFGELLAAFTGEHVGEPRVLICLYGSPLLHVDLKFVALSDVHMRVEEPAVLWERDRRVTTELRKGEGRYPEPDLQWIEDRFWIWMHYGALKIGRGELFEAIDHIAYVRSTVLGPLALKRAGARPQGVRRLEMNDPVFATELRQTLSEYDARDCMRALKACVSAYRELRTASSEICMNAAAETAAVAYMDTIDDNLKIGKPS